MARCVDCAWFPWKPGADLSGMAVTVPCYPGSPRRRWTNGGAASGHSCAHFKPQIVLNPAPEIVQEIISEEPEPQVEEKQAEPEKPGVEEPQAKEPQTDPERPKPRRKR